MYVPYEWAFEMTGLISLCERHSVHLLRFAQVASRPPDVPGEPGHPGQPQPQGQGEVHGQLRKGAGILQ